MEKEYPLPNTLNRQGGFYWVKVTSNYDYWAIAEYITHKEISYWLPLVDQLLPCLIDQRNDTNGQNK